MSETVFVGIRTHNSTQYIDKSLQSVYEQTYPKLHLVVYDDASNDDTLQKLETWQNKFASKGIPFEILSGQTNVGCGKAFESLGRAVAERMNNNDIFSMLDSDDSYTSPLTLQQIVFRMNKTKANVCLSGYTLQGDKNLVMNLNGGSSHNNTVHQLGELPHAVTVQNMPEIASRISSIGWTKIVKGEIFKSYMQMFPNINKEMSMCEDFPSLAMLLYKSSRITGLKESAYNYLKHSGSSTAQSKPEDFKIARIGFLKTLQQMAADNPKKFIPSAEDYINSFLETKYISIGDIAAAKTQNGILKNYTKSDFQQDFKKSIDCKDLLLCDTLDELEQKRALRRPKTKASRAASDLLAAKKNISTKE